MAFWTFTKLVIESDGVLDVHQVGDRETWRAFMENAVIVALLIVMLYGLGYAINRKTRLIDIINAILVFRIPFYVMVLWSSFPFFTNLFTYIEENKDNLVNLHLYFNLSVCLFLQYLYCCYSFMQYYSCSTASRLQLMQKSGNIFSYLELCYSLPK